ncbi:DNA oxidative demethylase AlkB [Rhizosaccharibacter radicis]|uniref:DNA oxidative demethylase AlkB n=1 Tax=Rhizosaccharibacter radicis TaxID=2782605 RepID=A0ABT1W1N0_9PROT|nr:DNA oxidative demethylase AlkB [Acetobacteraceae bacterium KSS12]
MDLLEGLEAPGRPEVLGSGASLLPGFARPAAASLLLDLAAIAERAPFRHLETPGGRRMSVAMTACGPLGWHSDRRGYRYVSEDPARGSAWPPMPASFRKLAADAARAAGFAGFAPDSVLLNRYEPGARLSLHQDRDEGEHEAPIVSVSLGLPATFLWGGLQREHPVRRLRLVHGDVAVWGGPSRFAFHGIAPLRPGEHPATGRFRFNITFRRVRPMAGGSAR